MLSSLGLYLVVLKWRGPAAAWSTQTELDRHIPFVPGWIWVYLFPYLIGPAIAGILTPKTFRWYVVRGSILVAATLLIFVIWPTKTVRPAVADLGTGVTEQLYRHIAEIDDPPANAAPSLHVSLTFLLALAVARDYPRWTWLTMGGAAIVWLATLLTWQHHLIDVVTGAALAGVLAIPWTRRRS
jgi:membrane-associated phospholipid phosphatase